MTLDELIEQLQTIRDEIGQGDVVVTDECNNPIYDVGFESKELENGFVVWISTQP